MLSGCQQGIQLCVRSVCCPALCTADLPLGYPEIGTIVASTAKQYAKQGHFVGRITVLLS